MRAALEHQGFKVVYLDSGDVIHATLRKDGGGSTTYAEFTLTKDDGYSNSVEILETAARALSVRLVPPAKVPETFREQDDFPYVTPLPGARRKPDYNLQLSASRAEAVKAWLVTRGVSASRLSTHGYGATQPVVPNDSDAHRARNRRVELKKAGCS